MLAATPTDLARFVDVRGEALRPSQGAEIDDVAVPIPQDAVCRGCTQERVDVAGLGKPDDRSTFVAPDGEAVDAAGQRAEILERTSSPSEGVEANPPELGLGVAASAKPTTIPRLLMKGN